MASLLSLRPSKSIEEKHINTRKLLLNSPAIAGTSKPNKMKQKAGSGLTRASLGVTLVNKQNKSDIVIKKRKLSNNDLKVDDEIVERSELVMFKQDAERSKKIADSKKFEVKNFPENFKESADQTELVLIKKDTEKSEEAELTFTKKGIEKNATSANSLNNSEITNKMSADDENIDLPVKNNDNNNAIVKNTEVNMEIKKSLSALCDYSSSSDSND